MSATASDAGASKSNGKRRAGGRLPPYPFFAICVNGYEPFLEPGKAYRVIRPEAKDPPHMFRVIDAEEEDYLYPRDWFVPLRVQAKEKRQIAAALSAQTS